MLEQARLALWIPHASRHDAATKAAYRALGELELGPVIGAMMHRLLPTMLSLDHAHCMKTPSSGLGVDRSRTSVHRELATVVIAAEHAIITADV